MFFIDIFLMFSNSTSAEKLMKLAYDTLDEACRQSNPQCAIQLFYTVRNMFELYCEVVPTFHKDSLLTLPQLSGKLLFQKHTYMQLDFLLHVYLLTVKHFMLLKCHNLHLSKLE